MTGFEVGLLIGLAALWAHTEITWRRRLSAHLNMMATMSSRITDLADELDRTKNHVSYIHTRLREGGK